MSTQSKILEILEKNNGVAISGEEMATILKVSRASVWKAIKSLKEKGYNIESTTNKGYCLKKASDILSEGAIKAYTKRNVQIIYKDVTVSTNDDLLQIAQSGCKDIVIEIASCQQGGRGRLGRTFSSPKGGIYISFLLHFKNIELKDVAIITPMAAVAVLKTAKKALDLDLDIKWVNDLFYKGKKICGILTQAYVDVENASTSSVVVGIGVDFEIDINTLPKEIINIVGTLIPNDQKTQCSANKFAGILIDEMLDLYDNFDKRSFIDTYKAHSIVLNKEINFVYNNEKKEGIVLDIDNDCALLIKENNGNILKINSGEVSIKLNK